MKDWLTTRLKTGSWQVLALLIVFMVAGPEILISMELMGIVEALGASTFVLAYLSGLRAYAVNWYSKIHHLESEYFFVPAFAQIKEMPGLMFHAIPWYSLTALFLGYCSLHIFAL